MMRILSGFGERAFCVAAAVMFLAGCGGTMPSNASAPAMLRDALTPHNDPMEINNDVRVGSEGYDVVAVVPGFTCMLELPLYYEKIPYFEIWKGQYDAKTTGKCAKKTALFNLEFHSSIGDASATWQKPPGEAWRIVDKKERGELCFVGDTRYVDLYSRTSGSCP